MTTIPQMECCTMLGIDPKTLRNWLRHAQEWFEWLCSLSSFRFIGHSGRFTAYREGLRSWRAYRSFRGQTHKQSLGTTDRLSIARLEEVAGMLQARLT